MSSPLAHAVGAVGAYMAATAPSSTQKFRGFGTLAVCVAMAVLPDMPALFVASGVQSAGGAQKWDVVALLHGFSCGLLAAGALAGAFPHLRESFWSGALVLFAAHSSQALVDSATLAGVTWLAPFDWHAIGFHIAILPNADIRILQTPFASAVKTMLIELGILLPLVWTAWIVGRDEGEGKSKGWIVAYALAWPAAAALAIWCVKTNGKPAF
ncbi:MAG: hypothetical protein FD180_1745 [Planctomycetota bacterium]|nr:MAG: hypothetical protein FD180_1745 [Planctomycetota bacterium]